MIAANPHTTAPEPAQGRWDSSIGELVAWTTTRLVNRTDAIGSYLPVAQRKAKRNALTRYLPPDDKVLERHYRGRDAGHLIGLHSTATDGTCRWIAFDIDAHDDQADRGANLDYANIILDRLESLELRGLLLDSNGAGGYHVLVLIEEPVPAAVVYRLARGLVQDCAEHGVPEVETFPKQAALRNKALGNWLRLPGRHHTRDHWTRVSCPRSGRWLDGADAARALVELVPNRAELVEAAAARQPAIGTAKPTSKTTRPTTSKTASTRRPASGSSPTSEEIERVRDALRHLDPDESYDRWIDQGLSLREWGDDGFALWDEWSRRGSKYVEGEPAEKWASFAVGGRGIGSLIDDARRAGWRDPRQARSSKTTSKTTSTRRTASGAAGASSGVIEGQGAAPEEHDQEHDQDERVGVEIGPRADLAVAAALAALARHPDVYTRAGRLVRVAIEPTTEYRVGVSPVRNVVPLPRLVELAASGVGVALSAVADTYQWRKTRDGEDQAVAVRCPGWLADAVAEWGSYAGIRALSGGMVDAPFPRPDGSIVQAPGYDPETETVLIPAGQFPVIPDRPDQAAAAAAAQRLLGVVRQFPWVGDSDRAAWLALVLTLVGRPSILGPTPATLVTANTRGSGKSLLLTVASVIGTGFEPPMVAYPHDPGEADKMVLSAALAGLRLVALDNVPEGSHLGNSALDRAVTARFLDGRELGKSRMVGRVPHRTLWAATGNNIAPRGDSARRWLPIRLVTDLERPEVRDDIEERDLVGWVQAHRPALVADALVVLRAHSVAGHPGTGKPPLGSFESWDKIVRGAVFYATGWDCTANLEAAMVEEPDRLALGQILVGWQKLQQTTGKQFLTIAEALRELDQDSKPPAPMLAPPHLHRDLHECLCATSRDGKLPTPRQLVGRLRSLKDRVVNGMRLKTLTVHDNLTAYGVESMNT